MRHTTASGASPGPPLAVRTLSFLTFPRRFKQPRCCSLARSARAWGDPLELDCGQCLKSGRPRNPTPAPRVPSRSLRPDLESSAGLGISRCFNMPDRRAGNSSLPQLANTRSKLPQPLARLWELRPDPGSADVSTCRFRMSNLRNLRPVPGPALLISSFPETVVVSRNSAPGQDRFQKPCFRFQNQRAGST